MNASSKMWNPTLEGEGYDIVSSGGQSIPMFDYYMAPGVLKTMKKELIKILKFEISIRSENLDSIDSDIEYTTNYINSFNSVTDIIDDSRVADCILDHALEQTTKLTYQAMEGFIHNMNTMHSRAGAQVPFSSINFGTDTTYEGRLVTEQYLLALEAGLGNGETPIFPISIFKVKDGVNYEKGSVNRDLFELAMRVSAKRMFPNFSFIDAPHNIGTYDPSDPNTEVAYMG